MTVAEELRFFLPPRHRSGPVDVALDGTSSLGHVVESLGVPLPEVGRLLLTGEPAEPAEPGEPVDPVDVTPAYRPQPGDRVTVQAPVRPQRPGLDPPRFLLDVHLGTLARRLRVLGIDAAYDPRADDDALLHRANAEGRLLLTQDRGLLRRRALHRGAYVRGRRPDEQLLDVLDRFAPPLAPFTRCPSCNGRLQPVPKADVEAKLQPGTRRRYDTFSRCADCGAVYWRGAHAARLDAIVASAQAETRAPPDLDSRRW